MFYRFNTSSLAATTILLLSAAFCTPLAAIEDSLPETERPDATLAKELGISAGSWERVGPASFTADFVPVKPLARAFEPTPQRASQDDPKIEPLTSITLVNVREQTEYRVTLPTRDLEFLAHVLERSGMTRGEALADGGMADDAREGGELRGMDPLAKGWSNAQDSRIRLNSTTSYPYRTIGTIYDGGGDCTGTLIGPRHMLTAAHCIYNRDTGTWSGSVRFKPGRNGDGSQPYGVAEPIWFWTPAAYRAVGPSDYSVGGSDIAVVVLDRNPGAGWISYASWSSNVLNQKTIFMRGYPRCSTTGAPSGCEPKTLWGDVKKCELGTYFDQDGSGWSRRIKTNCDGSAGQSGSSFYYYENGAAHTTGVFTWHYCLGACPPGNGNDAWPNVITRITPSYYNVISWFRSTYP